MEELKTGIQAADRYFMAGTADGMVWFKGTGDDKVNRNGK